MLASVYNVELYNIVAIFVIQDKLKIPLPSSSNIERIIGIISKCCPTI